MKAQALFVAAGLLMFFAGCQENAVEPIVVKSNDKPVPAFRTLQLKENIEFKTPDGHVGVADVRGEITYKLAPLAPAALPKVMPVENKPIYDLRIEGRGEMLLGSPAADGRAALAKPEVWSFAGELTSIVEDGARGIEVVFTITGTKWISHYHVSFILAGGFLTENDAVIDFHQNME
jgi:hypothetical protein